MSTFTLAISCLTTFNLPWFMDLTFQVSMQYCSLQNQTLLPSPVASTTGCCFCFGSVSSFFLEQFLYCSPVAYCAPTDLGSSSFIVISLPFHTVHGVLKARILKFFASVDHTLSELSTMTCPSWLALQIMLKILQVRLQQYMNWELPDVQAGFRKGIEIICQYLLDHRKSKRVPEKHLLLLYWLLQSLWMCGSQQTVKYSSRDGNTRPPYLSPEECVCQSRN